MRQRRYHRCPIPHASAFSAGRRQQVSICELLNFPRPRRICTLRHGQTCADRQLDGDAGVGTAKSMTIWITEIRGEEEGPSTRGNAVEWTTFHPADGSERCAISRLVPMASSAVATICEARARYTSSGDLI